MKHIRLTLALVALGAVAQARQSNPDATVGELSRSAEQELSKSIEELNRLRDVIAGEKLPLSQKLTEAEERVATLRKDFERISRVADAGALDIAKIQQDTKLRQEELSYVGNLLDEYARTFESKIGVGEMQAYGEAVQAAKQATENTTLSLTEKFGRQLDFAKLTIRRLFDVIGGVRFPGVAVDLQGAVSKGQFAIFGPVALFRAESGAAGIVVPQTGSDKPLVRPLEGPVQTGLAALVETGEGVLPLDPSRGGALKALVQKTSLIHIFEKGGPIMWPLLAASILALGTVLERLFFLFNERRKRSTTDQENFFAAAGHGRFTEAVSIGRASKDYVVRSLTYALEHRETSLPNALNYAQGLELKRFRRGIPVLDTVITLAPLLGLLGTVTGMMGSFSLIGGELSAPGAITGGIAEALIATAFGLGIAITALLPFNFLNTKLDEASHELEAAGSQLKLIVQPEASVEKPAATQEPAPAAPQPRTPHMAGAGKG